MKKNGRLIKIENLRKAERDLIAISNKYDEKENVNNVLIESFDTPISKSCVPLMNKKCLLFPDSDEFRIHGIRAIESSELKVTSTTTSNIPIGNEESKNRPPLVLLHGYCGASLYFYQNLNGLSHHFKKVYALDMFGWGLSSRPPFETIDNTVESTEAVFVESLEAWRHANGIDKMMLGGHSMGGYFSVAYCEKYPDRVDKLILISPVGVHHLEGDHQISNPLLSVKIKFILMKTLWHKNFTPGSFIRSLSESRRKRMILNMICRKLPPDTSDYERNVFCEYFCANNTLPGSGEYALHKVLKVLFYALKPTIYRIPKLKVPKITFVYGESDWMDPSGGVEVRKKCKDFVVNNGDDVPNIDILTVGNAGHDMFFENYKEFNAAIIAADNKFIPVGQYKPKQFDPSLYRAPYFAIKYALKSSCKLYPQVTRATFDDS